MSFAEHLTDNVSHQWKHDFLEVKGVSQSFPMRLVFYLFTSEIFIVCITSDSNFLQDVEKRGLVIMEDKYRQ